MLNPVKYHPGKLMIVYWAVYLATFSVMPIQTVDQNLTFEGYLILSVFLMYFVLGSVLINVGSAVSLAAPMKEVKPYTTMLFLTVASLFATVCLVIDVFGKYIFDLSEQYVRRDTATTALLAVEPSPSSFFFQLAFLFYPSAYVYSVAHVLYGKKLKILRFLVIGVLPVLLYSVVSGGRSMVFYLFFLLLFAALIRSNGWNLTGLNALSVAKYKWLLRSVALLSLLLLTQYSSSVFLARSESVGGAETMILIAENQWGVMLSESLGDFLLAEFGSNVAYLLLVNCWYFFQGIVKSNLLFSTYDHDMMLGAYGIDIVTAILRRLDQEFLKNGFDYLAGIGAYGFFPTAWGSLYVDFWCFGVIFCLVWGMFCSLGFRRINLEQRQDWQIVALF